jgi:PAS domain S-box-containing protein
MEKKEEELQRAHELLEAITKGTDVIIAAQDTNFCYTFFNEAYAEEIKRITGRDIAIGTSMVELYKDIPEELNRTLREWSKVLQGENVNQMIEFGNHGQGRKIYHVLHTPIRDMEGTIVGAGEVAFDVTRQEQMEETLRETSLYLESLINYANAPIVVWDPDFRITRFNHAFEFLTGRSALEIIGQHLGVLFPKKYLDASMEIIRKTMSGEQLNVVEIPILNRQGEIRIVLWNSATLFEADGKTIHSTIAQGNDITERKMAETELAKKNDDLSSAIEELTRREIELNEALKEREILLSEIHHRVKNNLTAFISLLSLKGSYDETPAGSALKKDLQNRARSMALIHETLYKTGKFSQVDMSEYLTPLIHQVALSYNHSSSIRTVVETDSTLDLTRATPCGLIITELVTNSFKYAFPESFDCMKERSEPCTIRISLKSKGETHFLTISDNGIGLSPGFNIRTAQTLGLRLVYFLAKHQLKATIGLKADAGTEITFRFSDKHNAAGTS